MKVAFATEDLKRVEAHFGRAKNIAVYDVTPEDIHFVTTYEFGGDLEEDGNEDKLGPKLQAIEDCAILYVAAIGGSVAARVVARKIHPIKVSEPEVIDQILLRPECDASDGHVLACLFAIGVAECNAGGSAEPRRVSE